jgi:soluble lytic murein transglycosylase-like protein
MAQTLSVTEIAARATSQRPAFNVPWRPALQQYAAAYQNAAAGTRGVDPCMLAAIVARESGGQNILQIGLAPGPGCGVGLCQITSGVDWSVSSAPTYPNYGPLLDPNINLQVAAHEFLDPLLQMFPNNHIAVFAAYNVGGGAVKKEVAAGLSPDAWTTGHDYGTAVFSDWINFVAASLGVNVDWANHKPVAPAAPPTSGPLARPPQLVPGGDVNSDLSNN